MGHKRVTALSYRTVLLDIHCEDLSSDEDVIS